MTKLYILFGIVGWLAALVVLTAYVLVGWRRRRRGEPRGFEV